MWIRRRRAGRGLVRVWFTARCGRWGRRVSTSLSAGEVTSRSRACGFLAFWRRPVAQPRFEIDPGTVPAAVVAARALPELRRGHHPEARGRVLVEGLTRIERSPVARQDLGAPRMARREARRVGQTEGRGQLAVGGHRKALFASSARKLAAFRPDPRLQCERRARAPADGLSSWVHLILLGAPRGGRTSRSPHLRRASRGAPPANRLPP